MSDNSQDVDWEYVEYTRNAQFENHDGTVHHAWMIDEAMGDINDITPHENFLPLDEYPIEDRRDQLVSKTMEIASEGEYRGYQWKIDFGLVERDYMTFPLRTSERPWDENTPEYLNQEFISLFHGVDALAAEDNDIRVLQTRIEAIE